MSSVSWRYPIWIAGSLLAENARHAAIAATRMHLSPVAVPRGAGRVQAQCVWDTRDEGHITLEAVTESVG